MSASVPILIVEDELLLAIDLAETLTERGAVPVHVTTVAAAFQMISTRAIAGAILDVDLQREQSYPVMEELRRRNVPFLITTGHHAGNLHAQFQEEAYFSKPYRPDRVVDAVLQMIENRDGWTGAEH
jgi:DNA-binding response OmpR family regulator